ncbi:Calpain-2 catalytic subunit [Acipenser ruthenus]|uniref:Calpain-3 n=1 Tax=Acipenser ruthenus TaxID=7906 RepID=A0A662YQJ5_ACIRT|nr:Calpain-2 catalytic subunit [Acipenser ruthenus]
MPYTPSGFFCDRLIRERERKDGEGSLVKPIRFVGQDFSALKEECLRKKTVFEDDYFQATVESLGYKELGPKSTKVKNILWKRPKVRVVPGRQCEGFLNLLWDTLKLANKILVATTPMQSSTMYAT